MQGLTNMEESSFVQWQRDEGEMRGLRQSLLVLGQRRFGPPSPGVANTLNVTHDLSRLRQMMEAIIDASTWDDLLATPETAAS